MFQPVVDVAGKIVDVKILLNKLFGIVNDPTIPSIFWMLDNRVGIKKPAFYPCLERYLDYPGDWESFKQLILIRHGFVIEIEVNDGAVFHHPNFMLGQQFLIDLIVVAGQPLLNEPPQPNPNEPPQPNPIPNEVYLDAGLVLSHKKEAAFMEWYSEVVIKGDLIELNDLSRLYFLSPWIISIWEIMQTFFDSEIKKMKIKNCNFPYSNALNSSEKESDHVEGFAPEDAWVLLSGGSDVLFPSPIRPTREAVMYPSFSKRICGHRDLPLRFNQWCNDVCGQLTSPTPFIRSHVFLWQEGHTAFATKAEADIEIREIMELYRRIYEEYLAIPVVVGKKSENEKFTCALCTSSIEAFIPNTGCWLQGATLHSLGQKFSNVFGIKFENEHGEKKFVWQNSWGYSTHTIGVMVMVHGDDKGLVLPPKVASIQVIVIPVPYKDADTQAIFDACSTTVEMLNEAGFRAEADLRDNYSPGWKYSHWELKGVPLRIEIGPKDMANNQVRVVRRDNGSKADIPTPNLVEQVKGTLDSIQQSLFDAAKQKRDASVVVAKTWGEFTTALNAKKMILAPWCDEEEVERYVKIQTDGEMGVAKTICTPFEQPEPSEGTLCFASGKPATKLSYWGRSY